MQAQQLHQPPLQVQDYAYMQLSLSAEDWSRFQGFVASMRLSGGGSLWVTLQAPGDGQRHLVDRQVPFNAFAGQSMGHPVIIPLLPSEVFCGQQMMLHEIRSTSFNDVHHPGPGQGSTASPPSVVESLPEQQISIVPDHSWMMDCGNNPAACMTNDRTPFLGRERAATFAHRSLPSINLEDQAPRPRDQDSTRCISPLSLRSTMNNETNRSGIRDAWPMSQGCITKDTTQKQVRLETTIEDQSDCINGSDPYSSTYTTAPQSPVPEYSFPPTPQISIAGGIHAPTLPLENFSVIRVGTSRGMLRRANGHIHRRRAFRNEQEKIATAMTRIRGACKRCHEQRKRCDVNPKDPDGPCLTCSNLRRKPECVRNKISGINLLAELSGPNFNFSHHLLDTDITDWALDGRKFIDTCLFAKGTHPNFKWTRRWKNMETAKVTNWAPDETRKTIALTQEVADLSYNLTVRKFILTQDDEECRTWKNNGVNKSYKCTPYAIESTESTANVIINFVNGSISKFVKHYIPESNILLYMTYDAALTHAQSSQIDEEELSLILDALRLWVALRMESKSEFICGKETLGMAPQLEDENCFNYKKVLVPPVLSAQIESITFNAVLNPLKKKVLYKLEKMMRINKLSSWYTTYLCSFLLLHSCSMFSRFELVQAQKLGLKTKYVYTGPVRDMHHGAITVLAHFHSKKGSYPLRANLSEPQNLIRAELTDDQYEVLRQTQKLVREQASRIKQVIRDKEFEDDLYFVSQLYDSAWTSTGKV